MTMEGPHCRTELWFEKVLELQADAVVNETKDDEIMSAIERQRVN